MSMAISSKRYAQAVFLIAQETDRLDKWKSYLGEIAEIMQDSRFAAVLENPKISLDAKLSPLKKLLGDFEPEVLNFASLLVIKNKFRYAPQIADHYGQLLDEYHGIKRSTITTSLEMEKGEQDRLTGNLERITGHKLKSDFKVDPEILGGFIARLDGTLIDGSIKNRLMRLKNSISTQV